MAKEWSQRGSNLGPPDYASKHFPVLSLLWTLLSVSFAEIKAPSRLDFLELKVENGCGFQCCPTMIHVLVCKWFVSCKQIQDGKCLDFGHIHVLPAR